MITRKTFTDMKEANGIKWVQHKYLRELLALSDDFFCETRIKQSFINCLHPFEECGRIDAENGYDPRILINKGENHQGLSQGCQFRMLLFTNEFQ